jgi:hypothetical protein
MHRNNNLKVSVQSLAEKVLLIFEAHVSQLDDAQHDTMMVSITLRKLEQSIQGTKEFAAAREQMQADAHILLLVEKHRARAPLAARRTETRTPNSHVGEFVILLGIAGKSTEVCTVTCRQ